MHCSANAKQLDKRCCCCWCFISKFVFDSCSLWYPFQYSIRNRFVVWFVWIHWFHLWFFRSFDRLFDRSFDQSSGLRHFVISNQTCLRSSITVHLLYIGCMDLLCACRTISCLSCADCSACQSSDRHVPTFWRNLSWILFCTCRLTVQ